MWPPYGSVNNDGYWSVPCYTEHYRLVAMVWPLHIDTIRNHTARPAAGLYRCVAMALYSTAVGSQSVCLPHRVSMRSPTTPPFYSPNELLPDRVIMRSTETTTFQFISLSKPFYPQSSFHITLRQVIPTVAPLYTPFFASYRRPGGRHGAAAPYPAQ